MIVFHFVRIKLLCFIFTIDSGVAMSIKVRLAILNFLHMGAWGAYLISMGNYFVHIGLANRIGSFYALIGIVSFFTPTIAGIIADRYIQPVRVLGLCHLLCGLGMLVLFYIGGSPDAGLLYSKMYLVYFFCIACYMGSYSLVLSVSYTLLEQEHLDTVKHFPSIRVFGSIGFVVFMWLTDLFNFEASEKQFMLSGIVSLVFFLYTFTLPVCEQQKQLKHQTLREMFGLNAFGLFKNKELCIFFIFSALLGINLQIANAYGTPYLSSFSKMAEYADSFAVKHSNILYSLSQISECVCLLLIPFFLKRFGIKAVMLLAMAAWALRFFFLGAGNPGSGLYLLILSMVVYGFAFDFFVISSSIYIDKKSPNNIRSSAQGLFWMMANGVGSSVGSMFAQSVINMNTETDGTIDWYPSWMSFSIYALVICILFFFMFHPKVEEEETKPAGENPV